MLRLPPFGCRNTYHINLIRNLYQSKWNIGTHFSFILLLSINSLLCYSPLKKKKTTFESFPSRSCSSIINLIEFIIKCIYICIFSRVFLTKFHVSRRYSHSLFIFSIILRKILYRNPNALWVQYLQVSLFRFVKHLKIIYNMLVSFF